MLEFLEGVHRLIVWLTVLAGIASVIFWAKSGFWVPRYIHFMAFSAFLLGAGLAWLARISGDPLADRHALLIIVFPLAVYVTFAFYGGVRIKPPRDGHRRK